MRMQRNKFPPPHPPPPLRCATVRNQQFGCDRYLISRRLFNGFPSTGLQERGLQIPRAKLKDTNQSVFHIVCPFPFREMGEFDSHLLRSQACTRFPQVLTSVENLLAVGVMKPSLPSSSTTAKPSNVIQYSISLMWTPFRSKHGPPDTHTHTQKDPLHEQIMRQF